MDPGASPDPPVDRPSTLDVPYLAPHLGGRLPWILGGLGLVGYLWLLGHEMSRAFGTGRTPPVLWWLLLGFVAAAAVTVLLASRPHAPMHLWREASTLEGLPAGPIPLDTGRIHVTLRPPSADLVTGEVDARPVFDIRHEGPDGDTLLFRAAGEPRRIAGPESHVPTVRAVVEGVCRVGGYPLVWTDAAGDEVRSLEALDAPLVARLAGAGTPSGEAVPDLRFHRAPDGTVALPVVQTRFVLGSVLAWLLGSAGLLTVLSGGHVLVTRAGSLAPAGILFGVVVVAAVTSLLRRRTLEVGPAGVRRTLRILGRTLEDVSHRADEVESLYVVPGRYDYRLMIAGDGFYELGLVVRTVEEATAARGLLTDALLGRGPPAPAAP